MNIYEQIKDMPNPSEGLLKFFKKHKWGSVWAYKDHYKVKDFTTLKELSTLSFRQVTLRVGSPTAFGVNLDLSKGRAKARAFSGSELKQHMFTGRNQGDVCLVGIGSKNKPVWMIDVTEQIIKQLNTIGACALSKAHCKFEQVSPNIKQCKFCGDKLRKKVETIKKTEWIREE